MKYNLLQVVQLALSKLDDVPVNTIDETAEALQIVDFANDIYNDLMLEFPWAHLKEVVALETTTTDHVMAFPVNVVDMEWLRYNKKDVTYIEPHDMTELLDSRDSTLATIDSNGAYDDRDPEFWTTYDQANVTFDAYDSSLTASLSAAYASLDVSVLDSDTDEPNMTHRFHPVWRNGIIAEALNWKGETSLAAVYERRTAVGKAALHAWARKFGREGTSGQTYGRKQGIAKVYTKVIEGS